MPEGDGARRNYLICLRAALLRAALLGGGGSDDVRWLCFG